MEVPGAGGVGFADHAPCSSGRPAEKTLETLQSPSPKGFAARPVRAAGKDGNPTRPVRRNGGAGRPPMARERKTC